jgi:ferredoxin
MSVQFILKDAAQAHDSGLCERNLNLLAHAQALELDIGSECGGHGICGGDRIRLEPAMQKLVSRPTEAERELLSEEELSLGWRLACQCFPNQNDAEIRAEYP